MTDAKDLIRIDIMEQGRERRRYYKQTNLPTREAFANKPAGKTYRRDRVLHRLMRLEMAWAVKQISNRPHFISIRTVVVEPAKQGEAQ